MRLAFLTITIVMSLSASVIAADGYFPVGQVRDTTKISSFEAKWYEEQLDAMHEQSLFANETSTTVYRFLWLRTFDHPMVFRLDVKQDGSGVLAAKMADGAGGYKPGTLVKDISISVSAVDVASFETKFEDTTFWAMDARVLDSGLDGAQWIWEVKKMGLYKIVDRSNAAESNLGKIAFELMKKSGLELGKIY
jgi:hypothetical protein